MLVDHMHNQVNITNSVVISRRKRLIDPEGTVNTLKLHIVAEFTLALRGASWAVAAGLA